MHFSKPITDCTAAWEKSIAKWKGTYPCRKKTAKPNEELGEPYMSRSMNAFGSKTVYKKCSLELSGSIDKRPKWNSIIQCIGVETQLKALITCRQCYQFFF